MKLDPWVSGMLFHRLLPDGLIRNLLLLSTCTWHAVSKHTAPIHREAPTFVEQGTEQEILVTGIKVSSWMAILDEPEEEGFHPEDDLIMCRGPSDASC